MKLNGRAIKVPPPPRSVLGSAIDAATSRFGESRYQPCLASLSGWSSAKAFFTDAEAVEEFLSYEASFNPGTDRKAAAAFMLSDYLISLSGLVVPLYLHKQIVPDLEPGKVLVQFRIEPHSHANRDYQFRRAWFSLPADEGKAVLPAKPEALGEQVELHLRPLIEQLNRLSGLGRSSLWRLVADAIAGRFLEFGRAINEEDDACQLALEVIRRPGSVLSNRQVGYFDLSVPDGSGKLFRYRFRSRGGCCRYYSVEGGKLCKTCVLKPRAERDADLRLAMAERLGSSPSK